MAPDLNAVDAAPDAEEALRERVAHAIYLGLVHGPLHGWGSWLSAADYAIAEMRGDA